MSQLNKESLIFIAGHKGMVGSALRRHLLKEGYQNILTASRKDLDLINQAAVSDFLAHYKPHYVVIAAAKVGGILANSSFPADFIYENLMIELNLIHQSFKANIKDLLFLGSSCIYPKFAQQPMKEDSLLQGALEPTNEPYAVAKIAGIKLCQAYNSQYQTNYRSLMPTNLYGEGDNFNNENSHVIPGLLNKFHEAKIGNKDSVEVWGTGKVKREFLHVDDLAEASLFIMKLDEEVYKRDLNSKYTHINVGTGIDISILDLAKLIKKVVGFEGKIIFNSKMPDGTPRKLLDVSLINDLGWKSSITLEDGLHKLYSWYFKNLENLRK